MLTLYKPPRSRGENHSDSSVERIIPAGTPYLTKVNGQLVMVREKKNKVAEIAVDLLGEAFGVNTRVIRKRSKSVDRPKVPLLIEGVPYVPQQQLTYTAPLPQQAFPAQSLAQYLGQHPSSFRLSKPTQKDFDQLQQINAHFNKMFNHRAPPHTHHTKDEVAKTTITITKHICVGCGRIRSKKYHQDHPLQEGDKPAPDFCRKCQKDSSSTSSGGTRRERREKGKKTKHRKHLKYADHSSDTKSSESSASQARTKPKHHATKKEPKRVPSEEYINVEEEFSEEEVPRPRSRGLTRERVIMDEYEVERRPLSLRNRQSPRTRSRSTRRKERFEIQRKPVRPPKMRETVVRDSVLQRSPSIEYRVVEAVPTPRHTEEKVETYPKKVPVYFFDDPVYESTLANSQYHRDQVGLEPESSGKDYSVEKTETVRRGPPSKEYFEERDTAGSYRSQEPRQRRRRERSSPVSPVLPPWETPHVLNPRNNDDVIVVTERFEYRPKKHYCSEEDRRRQEYVDRAVSDTHARTNHFSVEEAAEYYHEDWSRVESEYVREPQRREHPGPKYGKERNRDADISDPEASYEYRRADCDTPLRAPSPPSRIYESAKFENWQERLPYPSSPGSEAAQHANSERGGTNQRPPPIKIPREQSRNTSRVRPTYVREATDGRTEKALISSRRRPDERENSRYVEEVSVSDMTERERVAEGETRHVTFRDTPSIRSAHNNWTKTSESWQVEVARSENGWNSGFDRGNKGDRSGWNN